MTDITTGPDSWGEPEAGVEPVDSWTQVDPDFEDFADEPLDEVVEPPSDELTEEEEAVEPLEADPLLDPVWVKFELWGQNLTEGGERRLLSTQDFDGDLEAEVGDLTPGTDWRFWVRSIDADGNVSSFSEPVDTRLPLDLTPPPRPTAPTAQEAFGMVAIHHDGELENAEKPDDFSHIVLYAQQMHPPGNPSGPPGGARALARITQESSTVVGDFFSGIPHRVFAVAVDTTGNESARSEYVEVTPRMPFDDTELQETLRELNEEILPKLAEDQELLEQVMEQLNSIDLPGLEEALQNGLAEVNQNLIPLQQLTEQNKSRLDELNTTTLPGIESSLEAVESDLSTAQGQISTAQNQLNTLRNSTIPGLTSDLEAAQGELTTLNNDTIPELSRALSTGLDEANQWREVGAISASSLRVGNWGNLIIDPTFDSEWWSIDSAYVFEDRSRGGTTYHSAIMHRHRLTGGNVDMTSGRVRVTPGARYVLEFDHEQGGGANGDADDYRVWVRGLSETGAYVRSLLTVTNYPTAYSWTRARYEFQIPETESTARWMDVQWRFTNMRLDSIAIANPSLRQMTDSVLLVDGSVLTDKLAANAVVADKIAANAITTAKIATGAVTANEIAALTITANELAANSVTAGKILADAVTTAKIATNAVTANEIAVNTITADNIATNAIQTRHLQANSVGADQIIANSIGTDHLQARSVQAHQLQVGSFDNLFSDQQFTSYRDFSTGTNSPWVRVSGNPHNVWRWENDSNVGASIVSVVSGAVSRMELYCGEVTPGDQMSFRIRVRKTSGADGFRIHARHRGENRSNPLATTTLLGASFSNLSTDSVWEFNWTVPSNSGIRELWIDFETLSTSTGVARFSEPYMRRRIESQLLVEGSVLTDKLAANAVNADKIASNAIQTRHITAGSVNTNELAANAVNADKIAANAITTAKIAANAVGANEIAANAVTASQIRAGAIDGMLITGPTVQTSSTWSTRGGAVMRQDGTHGNFVAADSSGNVVARLGGSRNELTGLSVSGTLSTRPGGTNGDSITIDRTAWLGGNGNRPYLRFDATYNGYTASPGITTNPNEGMIIYGGDPASQIGTGAQITMNPARLTISPGITGQIRFDGALVSSAYAAVATGGTGVRNVGTGGVNMFVNYFVPLPHGQRFVTVSAESTLASQGRIIGTTIQDKDGSGFNVLMRRVDNLDAGTTGTRLNWIAARTNVS